MRTGGGRGRLKMHASLMALMCIILTSQPLPGSPARRGGAKTVVIAHRVFCRARQTLRQETLVIDKSWEVQIEAGVFDVGVASSHQCVDARPPSRRPLIR
jgi:hypothetical protein